MRLTWQKRYWQDRLEEGYRDSVIDSFDGILLCDMRVQKEPDEFAASVKDALFRIRRFDPRRYRRIQRHVRYVSNEELVSGGAYVSRVQACLIDFSRYRFDIKESGYGFWLECLLIHEATHGALHARGIPYTKASRLRVERLCRAEERRYLKRAYPWTDLGAYVELDEEWLKQYWGFWSSLKLYWIRAREIIK
ncbi:MAG: hypothetical protein KY468_20340 [Armatimonadetes bacterium]|nr:hypothetical protein [Armatimonadota bacterium]